MRIFTFLSLLFPCIVGTIIPCMAQVPSSTPRTAATPIAKPAALKKLNTSSIRAWIPNMKTTDPNAVFDTSRSTIDVKLTTQYLDGLGRPFQTITRRISPTGNDLVTTTVYDSLGREQYRYLPYTQQKDSAHNGKIKSDPFTAQAAFFQDIRLNPGIADEHIYYSEMEYENSPLNRVLKSWAPGDSWAKTGGNHPVQLQYQYNVESDAVRIWNIGISRKTCSGTVNYGASAKTIPTTSGIYAAGQLTKNIIIDEAGHRSIEYKDKNGQLILKKSQISDSPTASHDGWLCTYYVYDDMYNLRFVIPPLAVQSLASSNWEISPAIADELCYQYQYDARGRMTSKKIAGTGTIYMAYDSRNRMVFTQDSVQRQKSTPEWLTTFYDGLNRPYETAIYTSSTTRDALQCSITTNLDDTATINLNVSSIPTDLITTAYNSTDNPYRATNSITFDANYTSPDGAEIDGYIVNTGGITNVVAANPVPTISSATLTPLTYLYYDNYNYNGALSFVSDDLSKLQAGNNPYSQTVSSQSTNVNARSTGGKVSIIGTDKWLTTTTYYDDEGRTIQTISENNVGGKNILSSLYDFSGKVLSSNLTHTNPSSKTTPKTTLLNMMEYDYAGNIISNKTRLNDSANLDHTLFTSTYNELGSMLQKRLGVTGTSTQLDTLTYTYNIRGWLTGINKAFVNSTNNSNWFGEEINYDNGFDVNQFNGNLSGTKWKSLSNGIPRALGYTYDAVNRLTKATFNEQKTAGAAWAVDKVDFTVNGITYDANGNISTLKEKGLIGTASQTIDDLTYAYQSNSNKLIAVTDGNNTSAAKLGDFIDGNTGSNDYDYNPNGSLTKDLNKSISAITYNYMNLPEKITITGKGSITYQYNAAGTKLKETIVDTSVSPAMTITSDYDGIFLYKKDTLQYISHNEGRIRPVYDSGKAVKYAWDYFERDHLGNTRIVLGTQTDTSIYAATMEKTKTTYENAIFANIDNTRDTIPAGYPADPTTSPNAFVSKLNAVSGQKVGPAIVLRVMAGDTISLGVKAFYKSIGTNTSSTTSENILSALVQALSGSTISDGAHGVVNTSAALESSITPANYDQLKSKDPDENLATKPKAYLNYVLFDDMFNMVDENSGVKQVQGSPDELQTMAVEKTAIKKTGFLYIYTSNESGENVYFDNLVVSHNKGPLLEETHYYPFGLTMAGISSRAINKAPENRYKWNKGSELLSKEFRDGSGLEWYATPLRSLDPQLGRWWQLDSKPDFSSSLYAAMSNNPMLYNDPMGDTLKISFRSGFLGTGKLQTVNYNNGVLTNADGSAYKGKINGYLGQVTDALKLLGDTKAGNELIADLQKSKNNFTIQDGAENNFDADSHAKSQGMNSEVMAAASDGKLRIPGGSGGTITWTPNSLTSGMNAAGSTSRPTFIGLGHEMAHAWDANNGTLFDKDDYTNSTTKVTYQSMYNGLKKAEWRAVYIENLIRMEAGVPLRVNYGIATNGETTIGSGPSLVAPVFIMNTLINIPITYPLK